MPVKQVDSLPTAGRLRVGVIGYGYWGPNLVRNFMESPQTTVTVVADLSEARLQEVSRRHPTVITTTDPQALIDHPDVDAVVVATPVRHHFELAMAALRAGRHTLVEKPLAANSADAMALCEEAKRRGLVLMVDHTFLYTGAVRKIVELVQSGEIGEVLYYDSVRVNLGLFQSDVNVIWDLAVHDLSIMDAVMPEQPERVSAVAVGHVPGQPENIAYITLMYPHNRIAHLHVNWLAPVKVRRTLIGGSDKMIVYDDIEPSEKVKVYDKGANLVVDPEAKRRALVNYRNGDMHAPRLDVSEGLRTEVGHFADCVAGLTTPLSDGQAGLRIIRILEAAEKSLSEGGRLVEVASAPTTSQGASR